MIELLELKFSRRWQTNKIESDWSNSPRHSSSRQFRSPRHGSQAKQEFSPGRSGRRPLLPKRKLNILVDLTLGKSYHSVVTFLHAQKIKCYTFLIQTSSKLISYYVCLWKVGPWVSYFFIRQCRNIVAKYLWSGGY